jgi:hypothetical protein
MQPVGVPDLRERRGPPMANLAAVDHFIVRVFPQSRCAARMGLYNSMRRAPTPGLHAGGHIPF